PDEAIAAGWLKEQSLVARWLSWLLRYSLIHSDRVVVLDRFAKDRIMAKGIEEKKIRILPPWSHDNAVTYDSQGREAFRRQHVLPNKLVVMDPGNHSPCHPLDTLLQAAHRLANRSQFAFYFVGGGSEQQKVRTFARQYELKNVACLPYQPLEQLSQSLSS